VSDNKRKTISIDELFELDKEEGRLGLDSLEKEKPKKHTKQELHEAKKENKHYLPVLHINDPLMWPSKPKSERRMFTDDVAKETCLSNCCGTPGVWGACCRLDPDDIEHVLGPVSEKCIKKILRHFKKKRIPMKRSDIVIDFEEGKLLGNTFFNGHPIFSQKTSYPIMRLQTLGPRFGCKFLNPDNGLCGIYEIRPQMCIGYYCQYIKANFLVRSKEHPNTYKKIDTNRNTEDDDD
jgi:Fe-S-cluster containining protein